MFAVKWFKNEESAEPQVNSDGSTYKVPLTTIVKVENHPDPETTRLELATVYGFQVVVQKGKYKVGDEVIYIPIDSIIPYNLEKHLFPEGSKIKLNKNRVRQIKIRKAVSQGMLIDPSDILKVYGFATSVLEADYSKDLEITKYEPPFRETGPREPRLRNRPLENPHFRKYNGVTNLKWAPTRFEGEEVVIQEKIHGSHIRFGKPPFVANTLWKKIKKLVGLVPKYEFSYGSNNVELTNRKNYTGFYGEDIYGSCLARYGVVDRIKDGEFVHGEVYGPGIQKNYDYGAMAHRLVIYDIRVMNEDGTQKWLNPEECEAYAKERGFDFVPVLYSGIFSYDVLADLTVGPSVLDPNTKVREGVVVKSKNKYDIEQNKQAFKSINPDYLSDPENTDFH